MRITINQQVKHDERVYHAGDVVTVDDELGAYFMRCGWASDGSGSEAHAQPSDVTLEVHAATHKSTATEN